MTIPAFDQPSLASRPSISALQPEPPAWVFDLFRDGSEPVSIGAERTGLVRVVRRDPFVRVTARVPGAEALDAAALSEAVSARYVAIADVVRELDRRPIRFWNYVPGIVNPVGPGMDRYMAFNRGRHAAYSTRQDGAEGFEQSVPAASAVGIAGPDLVIDCLASTQGGTPVENPRQIASWRYSRRYGPKPPYFARGMLTVLDGRRVLLVAGTASIVGEDSKHPEDVPAQVGEILRNMEALLVNAGLPRDRAFERLTDLRIYVVHDAHADIVETELRARTGPAVRVQTVLARVCRPELLVEVEGVAALD